MFDALSGSAYCWGDNTYGQLGNGTNTSSSSPVRVKDSSGALTGKIVTAVTAGSSHACALDSSGGAYCWGDNGSGQLGNASTANSSVPVRLSNSGAISGSTVLSQIDSTFRGWPGLVTDRIVPVFGRGVWLTGFRRVAVLPDVLGSGTGSDRAGAGSFRDRGDGVAGQAGAGRAHSRCQQARKASFQGQVRLIFSTRARAWRASRAGSDHSR